MSIVNVNLKTKKLNMESNEGSLRSDYEWYPNNVSLELFEKYLTEIPEHKRPLRKKREANEYRQKQVKHQLPLQDFDVNLNESGLTQDEINNFKEFYELNLKNSISFGRLEQNIDENLKCNKCKKDIELKAMTISAPILNEDYKWHPNCFTCYTCDELLIDLIYFGKYDKLFCGRHYSELMKKRCAACDQLIFTDEYTRADGKWWHLSHFKCFRCNEKLAGSRYVTVDEQACCIKCYEEHYAKTCQWCTKKIGVNCQRLNYENSSWHATANCFGCFTCRKSLLDQPFIYKNGLTFCSVTCKRRIIPKNSNHISRSIQF